MTKDELIAAMELRIASFEADPVQVHRLAVHFEGGSEPAVKPLPGIHPLTMLERMLEGPWPPVPVTALELYAFGWASSASIESGDRPSRADDRIRVLVWTAVTADGGVYSVCQDLTHGQRLIVEEGDAVGGEVTDAMRLVVSKYAAA